MSRVQTTLMNQYVTARLSSWREPRGDERNCLSAVYQTRARFGILS